MNGTTSRQALTFWWWLIKFGKRYLFSTMILALALIVPVLANYDFEIKDQLTSTLAWICAIHVFVIFIVISWPIKAKFFNQQEKETSKEGDGIEAKIITASGYENLSDWIQAKIIANKVLKQFRTSWKFIWGSWLLLYVALGAQRFLEMQGFLNFTTAGLLEYEAFQVFENLFNNASNIAFIISFIILTRPTVPKNSGETDDLHWAPWIVAGMLLFFLEAITIAYPTTSFIPTEQKQQNTEQKQQNNDINNSAAIYVLSRESRLKWRDTDLSKVDSVKIAKILPDSIKVSSASHNVHVREVNTGEVAKVVSQAEKNRNRYIKIFSWISGIGGGTIMALCIGRLGSMFLKPPFLGLVLLYVYSSIQALFLTFSTVGQEIETVTLMTVALVLKCLLFLYVTFLFESGRLLFYFVRARRLHEKRDDEWKDFSDFIN